MQSIKQKILPFLTQQEVTEHLKISIPKITPHNYLTISKYYLANVISNPQTTNPKIIV
jgi:hypothetical protein